jgi:hypothetical protein
LRRAGQNRRYTGNRASPRAIWPICDDPVNNAG